MLEIRKVHEDSRGEIFEVLLDKKQTGLIVSTKKGKARGGHYHPRTQEMYVVKGRFEYITMQKGRKETEKRRIIKEGAFISVPPNEIHMMIAKTDCVFFESMRGGYEAKNYPPYRKIVEEKMK